MHANLNRKNTPFFPFNHRTFSKEGQNTLNKTKENNKITTLTHHSYLDTTSFVSKPLTNINTIKTKQKFTELTTYKIRCMRTKPSLPCNTTMHNKFACRCSQIVTNLEVMIQKVLQPSRTNLTLVNQFNHWTFSMEGPSSTFFHLTIIWCPCRETKHKLTKIIARTIPCMRNEPNSQKQHH